MFPAGAGMNRHNRRRHGVSDGVPRRRGNKQGLARFFWKGLLLRLLPQPGPTPSRVVHRTLDQVFLGVVFLDRPIEGFGERCPDIRRVQRRLVLGFHFPKPRSLFFIDIPIAP